jgi:hypothetical protein
MLTEVEAEAALHRLNIPGSFPVDAGFFDDRVASFATAENCTTLAKLAANPLPAAVVYSGKDIPNFGAVSAQQALDFQRAVAARDPKRLRDFVPVSLRGGIDLGYAAARAAEACSLGLDGLKMRLIDDATLETVGARKNLTKERVRQIEEDFTTSLSKVLAGIPGENERVWNEWERTGQVTVQTDETEEIVQLVRAALDYSFSRREESRDLRSRQYELAEVAADALARQPDIYRQGIDGRIFCETHFSALRWHRFLEWNERAERFLITEGVLLRMGRPKARDVVAALLETGIRSPRRIIEFLFDVPLLRSWHPKAVSENCADWRQTEGFPAVDLVDEAPDLSPRPRAKEEFDASALAEFVRQTGPRPLLLASGAMFTVEPHRDGLIILSGAGHSRRFDLGTIQEYVEVYHQTKSKKTTAYGGFHASYFIPLVDAFEQERPYVPLSDGAAEIDESDLDIIFAAQKTEQAALLLNRVGQGKFRSDLLAQRKCCYITGLADPRFLRASHIKPWRDCNGSDRLDWRNGLLLTPNLDLLFDRGLISFADDGTLLVSSTLPADVQERFGLKAGFKGTALCARSQAFMAEHRATCFRP